MGVDKPVRRVKRKKPKQDKPNTSATLARKIFIIVIFCIAQSMFYYSDFFKLREIRVYGNNRVPDEQIIRTAEIPMDNNVVTLPLKNFQKRLDTIHWIKDTKLKWSLPGRVDIFVNERTPALLAKKKGNEANIWFATDENGMILYKTRNNETKRYPRLETRDEVAVGKTISAKAVKVVLNADSWMSADFKSRIIHYEVNPDYEVVMFIDRMGHPLKIKLGKIENMTQKIDTLAAFMELIDEKKDPIEYIDLRYNYPVIKPAVPNAKKNDQKDGEEPEDTKKPGTIKDPKDTKENNKPKKP